jgi:hypothetical protein
MRLMTWRALSISPYRQVWVSSPVSGPMRFDYDPAEKHWVYARARGYSEQAPDVEFTPPSPCVYVSI